MEERGKPFLTARWESLLMLNYSCPKELLLPHLPEGVQLDEWQGQAMMSLVGFRFIETKVKGIAVPGHQDFDELNLRFYVKRVMPDGEVRRGVVFIKELVPSPLIAWVARVVYEEPYQTVPMSHFVDLNPDRGGKAEYCWKAGGHGLLLAGTARGPAHPLCEGSEEEFITEHYWGYTRRSNGRTSEYQVSHPRWDVWRCSKATFTGDASCLYGPELSAILKEKPCSALLAVGSEVTVFSGRTLH